MSSEKNRKMNTNIKFLTPESMPTMFARIIRMMKHQA
jgi:hypothetical protein